MKILVVGNTNEAQSIRDNFQAQNIEAEVTCVSAYKHAIAHLKADQFDQIVVAQAKNLSIERQQAEIANLKRFQVPVTLVGESDTLAQSARVELVPRDPGYGTLIGTMLHSQALKSTERNRQLTQLEIKVATLEHHVSQIETLAIKLQEVEKLIYGDAKSSGLIDDVRDLHRDRASQQEETNKRKDSRLQYNLALIGAAIALFCALIPLIPFKSNEQPQPRQPGSGVEDRDRQSQDRLVR